MDTSDPVDIVKDATSSLEIPSEIIKFIKDNYDSLCAFANMEIDGPEFFDIIERLSEEQVQTVTKDL